MSFASQLETVTANIMLKTNEDAKKVVKTLNKAIVDGTPVLSGRLKGGWTGSQNAPITIETGRLDANGSTVLADLDSVVDGLPKNRDWTFFLANNVPYGMKIEYLQYSAKAPYGMVRVNISRIASLVKQALGT